MERPVQSHRDLKVWQKAMDLAVEIYGSPQDFLALKLIGSSPR